MREEHYRSEIGSGTGGGWVMRWVMDVEEHYPSEMGSGTGGGWV